jgi:hypothetical protein
VEARDQIVAAIGAFIDRHGLGPVHFAKDQRRDDVTRSYLADHDGTEQILYVGRAQEKASVVRTERRFDPRTGASYAWLVKATALVNHFYYLCAARRFVVSPAQLGGTWRIVPGSDGLPGAER